MYFDWTYIVLVMPAVLFAMWASAKVNSTFAKYKNSYNSRHITGAQAARWVGPQFSGLLVALPLLLAACLWGGIGGGDIKLMAALGLVFGFWVCFWGLIIALLLLIAYHLARKIKKIPTGAFYPMVPFLFVGIVFGCLFV